ncbi:hypothetical protein TNCT_174011 [Trichonephila clavata]|uniref:Uncharacterized protein n=1 Tax=Trichonephila clavata TaxID=2740835 RepID=A0A8X6HXC0_TRICU|nr:hypothetical protein TNCT_174011 [Trichonephila clavata]
MKNKQAIVDFCNFCLKCEASEWFCQSAFCIEPLISSFQEGKNVKGEIKFYDYYNGDGKSCGHSPFLFIEENSRILCREAQLFSDHLQRTTRLSKNRSPTSCRQDNHRQ